MMSEPKRLHPITIIFNAAKNVKEVIIPLLLYFAVFAFKDGINTKLLMWAPAVIVLAGLVLMGVPAFISWLRYTYRVEDMELRIEYGLFVKKKRYIPFDRIQSLDFSEHILHRPFGLVKVKVETAGGNDDSAEAEMSAVKKEEAEALKRLIAEAKNSRNPNVISEEEVEVEKESILYKISQKQLLFIASTSGSAGVVLSAIFAFASQFNDIIPFEKFFDELQHIVKAGYVLLGILIIIGLILAWIISVVMAYLKYNDFTLKVVENDLVITRGLLEKRTTTIPIRRIQAIRIQESPFRQPFGYASVSVEYAGSAIDEKAEGLIIPVVKKNVIGTILRETLTDYSFHPEIIPAPRSAKSRYLFIKFCIFAIVTLILSIWLWPYGLLSALLIIGASVLGLYQFKSAGYSITGSQLTLRYRGIDQQTVLMKKNRIQSVDMSVNWFQKRAGLASVETSVMSGGNSSAKVKHIRLEDAKEIYEWYRPNIVKADHGNI